MGNIQSCATCKHLVSKDKGNRYGDKEHFCLKIGYFVSGINKDIRKYEHLSPGGKKLNCEYDPINNPKP